MENIGVEGEGKYTCVAANIDGSVEKMVDVEVSSSLLPSSSSTTLVEPLHHFQYHHHNFHNHQHDNYICSWNSKIWKQLLSLCLKLCETRITQTLPKHPPRPHLILRRCWKKLFKTQIMTKLSDFILASPSTSPYLASVLEKKLCKTQIMTKLSDFILASTPFTLSRVGGGLKLSNMYSDGGKNIDRWRLLHCTFTIISVLEGNSTNTNIKCRNVHTRRCQIEV